MNVYAIAARLISGIHPNIEVTFIKKRAVINGGIATFEEDSVKAYAQVQPTSQDVIAKDTYLQGVDNRTIWVIGDVAEVLNFFKSATASNTTVEIYGKKWTVYKKEDWGLNGFIKVIAVLNDEQSEEEDTETDGEAPEEDDTTTADI